MAKTKKTVKLTTKAIGESAGVSVNAGGSDASVVATQSLDRALTPRQAYEMNPTFRRAVSVIADNESKAQVRLFSRQSGDEITSGPAFDLFSRPSMHLSIVRFIADMSRWWKVAGEIAILPLLDATGTPFALKLLNPAYLTPYPSHAKSIEFVTHWVYADGMAIDGKTPQLQIPAERLIFAKNFNPYSELRGLSEALTLINEVSTNHYIQRFNVSYFKNGCSTDLILRFPKGTKKKTIEDFVERWQEMHSIRADNGFRIAAFAGDEMQMESPTNLPKEGSFLDLHGKNEEAIAGMLGVPASVMGFYSKTRFDTIDAELETFAENTLLPDLRHYSEVLQQIVDRFFPSAVGTGKVQGRKTKALKKALNEAGGKSDIVIILDGDTLPIMGRLQQAKIKTAKDMREALDMSASEVIEYLDLDIANNPVRDDIWVPSGRVNISQVQQASAVEEEVKALKETVELLKKMNEEPKVLPIDAKEKIKAMQEFYRHFRQVALDVVDGKKSLSEVKGDLLKEVKGMNINGFDVQFHKDFLAINTIIKGDSANDKVRAVKDYLNGVSRPNVMKAFTENVNG